MRARRGLIPPSFLVLVLSLILVSCSGGSEAPQSLTEPPPPPPPPPPAQVSLIYSTRFAIDAEQPDGALIRSQTDGSGQVLLSDQPGLITAFWQVFVSGSTMVYHLFNPPAHFEPRDIWRVQLDGTGARPVGVSGSALDVIGPWVVYEANGTTRAVRLDGTGDHLITTEPVTYHLHIGDRLVFMRSTDGQVFSVLLDGTDRRVLITLPLELTVLRALGSQVIVSVFDAPSGHQQIVAVPITGGPITTLADGANYNSVAALAGARLVYQRCPVLADRVAGPCDVYSVISDGTGTVALGTQSAYEGALGVSGSQVVIRRMGGATDTLYSIPITGGPETFMLTLGATEDNFEFTWGVVEERIIIGRYTDDGSGDGALLSLRPNGQDLVQLTDNAYLVEPLHSTGAFVCFVRHVVALWCVPADGSEPATKVTDHGEFVTGL
jgi:hypothetical protein